MSAKRYRTIMADPPWSYKQRLGRGNKDGDTAKGGLAYTTMTVEEIADVDVAALAEDNSICWLWTTNAHIHDALHVLDAWGFRYVTMATWIKRNFGLGYWLRGHTEHVLLGVKGRPRSKMIGSHGATGQAWSTLIVAPRGRHSEKPQAALDLVEALGEPPRLELFARQKRMGWDVWGDETFQDVDVRVLR